jgi:glycosyltransferase involved in cell wall biosynthesis
MFNPIRYTSLGLAVLEAMSAGLPLIALASTEYVTVIKDGYNGFIHTDVDYLIDKMKLLLNNKELAAELGANAKQTVRERFSIERFTQDWEKLFASLQLNEKKYEEESSIYQ